MNLYRKIFIISFFSMLYIISFAQNYIMTVEKFGLEEGLSQSAVNCMIQDSSGIIWIGTQDGLNKFDGYNFTTFRHEPFDKNSLSSNYIWDIEEDNDGNLWIATQLGFNKYTKSTGKFQSFYHNSFDTTSLSSNVVYNILIDSDHRIWVLTSESFDEFLPETEVFLRHKYFKDSNTNLSNYNNLAIYEDSQKRIWVGTKDGLNYFDKNTEKFKRYFNSDDNSSLSNNEIRAIYEDSDYNIWIGTQNGLNKLNQSSNTFDRYYFKNNTSELKLNIIRSISETQDGTLWIGTDNGLKIMDISNPVIQDFSNIEIIGIKEKISAIISDLSGIMWIAGWKGIYKVDIRPKKFQYFGKNEGSNSYELSDNYIYSIFVDNLNQIWAGSLGVNIINKSTKKVYNCQSKDFNYCISDAYVFCFYHSNDNKLWIGTNNGLYIYDLDANKFIAFKDIFNIQEINSFNNNRITSIIEDLDGNFWISSYNGLYKINKTGITTYNKAETQENGLTSNEIYSLLVDSDGVLWIGTVEGLNKYVKETDSFIWYTYNAEEGKGLSNNSVLQVFECSQGFIWIGTESGLNKFDKNDNSFEYFTCNKTNFINDYIYSILEDNNNNLWLSTNKGIVKFNKISHEIVTYGIKDGLQDYEFNLGACYKTKNGEMFFGGVNGFNSFFPDSMKINTITPKTVITKFIKSDNDKESEVFFDSIYSIELKYHENFTIYFSLPEYTKPENNQFQYKLEGITDEWSVPSYQHFANFSQLKPGTYTFQVRGANSDAQWNLESAVLKIEIIPPFYMTDFAYTIYILLGILLILLVFLYITRNMRIENQILVEKTKASKEIEKHKEELELKNTNITDSIHYAKIIIDAMLPSENILKKLIPDSFILFLPKDIVSGDFYWFIERNNKIFIAAVDCTGHGVPGAFMSIVGIDLFRNIINKGIYEPSEILNKMNEEVADVFEPENGNQTLKDGMDLGFCVIDKKTKTMTYSGAYNPLYLIRNNSLIEFKANRFSVGLISNGANQAFTSETYQLLDNDVIYLFSDGYTDQFGGNEAKKFKFRRFRHLLLSIHNLHSEEQKIRLTETYIDWKGKHEQVDDILIIGLKPFKENEYKENYF
jgi:ligand-binding sensor domain-containing protein/serine phosphatase RsbU (regulator of sigma subunit)